MGVNVEKNMGDVDRYPRAKEWYFDTDGSFRIEAENEWLAEYPKDAVVRVYFDDAELTAEQKRAADNADDLTSEEGSSVDGKEEDDV